MEIEKIKTIVRNYFNECALYNMKTMDNCGWQDIEDGLIIELEKEDALHLTNESEDVWVKINTWKSMLESGECEEHDINDVIREMEHCLNKNSKIIGNRIKSETHSPEDIKHAKGEGWRPLSQDTSSKGCGKILEEISADMYISCGDAEGGELCDECQERHKGEQNES